MSRSTNEEKLAEQHGFLKRSVAAFNDGHSSEAVRIATTLRVLVHETAKSTPLLKLLSTGYLDVAILDRRPLANLDKTILYIGVGVRMDLSKGTIHPTVDLKDPNNPMIRVPLAEWWNRVKLIFLDGSQKIVFTRKDLILTLADKEGGTHVDATLPAKFEKYVLESPLRFVINDVAMDTVNLARYGAVEAAVQMMDCLETNFPQAVK